MKISRLIFRFFTNVKLFDYKFLQHQRLVFNRTIISTQIQFTAELTIHFILPNGNKVSGKAKEGDTLLDVVLNNNLDFDGFGACEGTLSCSTCHLIFTQKDFNNLPQKSTPEELDMLDLAYELTETSRLGCQINLTKEMDGLIVQLPKSVLDNRLS
ncbi:unnamed protein product [Gordionus sp. m RMFG-2023]